MFHAHQLAAQPLVQFDAVLSPSPFSVYSSLPINTFVLGQLQKIIKMLRSLELLDAIESSQDPGHRASRSLGTATILVPTTQQEEARGFIIPAADHTACEMCFPTNNSVPARWQAPVAMPSLTGICLLRASALSQHRHARNCSEPYFARIGALHLCTITQA